MDNKPTKLRKVKTIAHPIRSDLICGEHFTLEPNAEQDCEAFDNKINKALAEGWYLVKRYTLPSYYKGTENLLVAELQRWDEYDE